MTSTTHTAGASRKRILDVAAHLFREKGYAGVSLRSIASDADLKAGSIYYHFASKDDLVVEVLDQGIKRVHYAVAAAVEDLPRTDGFTVLRTAVRAHLRSLLSQSDYASANVRNFGQVPATVKARCMATRQAYEAFWDDLLRDIQPGPRSPRQKERLRVARLLILGALNASLDWFDPQHGRLEKLADHYADLIWNGLGRDRGKH